MRILEIYSDILVNETRHTRIKTFKVKKDDLWFLWLAKTGTYFGLQDFSQLMMCLSTYSTLRSFSYYDFEQWALNGLITLFDKPVIVI